jgi:hypothetical protein
MYFHLELQTASFGMTIDRIKQRTSKTHMTIDRIKQRTSKTHQNPLRIPTDGINFHVS